MISLRDVQSRHIDQLLSLPLAWNDSEMDISTRPRSLDESMVNEYDQEIRLHRSTDWRNEDIEIQSRRNLHLISDCQFNDRWGRVWTLCLDASFEFPPSLSTIHKIVAYCITNLVFAYFTMCLISACFITRLMTVDTSVSG